MQMWAAGSSRSQACSARGFTLLELLVVVSIIAMATASVSFALRDSAQTQLEREAQRLAALFESARAQSRASGIPVRWIASPQGFHFEGLPPKTLPNNWLDVSTTVQGPFTLQLGPEPLIARQSITLVTQRQPNLAWRISTDGLRPFSVEAVTPVPEQP
jgi:general secretion pathway protein H